MTDALQEFRDSEEREAIYLRGTRRRLRTLFEAQGLIPDEEIADRARALLEHGGASTKRPPRLPARDDVEVTIVAPHIQAMYDGLNGIFGGPFFPTSGAVQPEHDEANCVICNPSLSAFTPRRDIPVPAEAPVVSLVPPAELFDRINLAEYLAARGYDGPRGAKVIAEFLREVRKAYVNQNGVLPPKRDFGAGLEDDFSGIADRALIDSVYLLRMKAIEEEVFGPQGA